MIASPTAGLVAGSRAHPPRPAPGHPVAPLEPSAPSPPQCWACAPAKGEKRHAGRPVPGRGPGTGGPTTDVERLTGVRPHPPCPGQALGGCGTTTRCSPQPPSHRRLGTLESVGAHGRPTHERRTPEPAPQRGLGRSRPTERNPMANSMTTFINALPDPNDFEQAAASVQDFGDGHIASVSLSTGHGHLQLQCDGDGARVLTEGLRLLADKVEAAHRAWLGDKAAEAHE